MTEDDIPDAPRVGHTASVSLAYVRGLVDYLTAHHIALPPTVSAWATLPRDARITMTEYAEALDRAATLGNDINLGLHVGESIRLLHYGVLGYVALSSETLGQALQHYRRYQALAAEIGQRIETHDERIRISWTPGGGPPHRHAAEANLAAWIGFARWIVDQPLPLIEVEFRHAKPADTSEHLRIFGCQPRFDRPRHALTLDVELLQQPLPQADQEMRVLMERHASKRLTRLNQGETLIERLRSFIQQQLASENIRLENAAAALNLGARALQRRLADEGHSFRELVDSVRREQAARYLDDPDIDLCEVALLLGFSEQSAFQRAFRRWYGDTPHALRQRGSVAGF